jgi:hypothetical protein
MAGSVPAASNAPASPNNAFEGKTVAFAATVPSMDGRNQRNVDFTATVPASAAEFEKTVVQRVSKPGEAN